MEYKRILIEDTTSLQNIDHVYVCSEDERANTLLAIKSQFPGVPIEVTRTGFKVKELRKKSDKEIDEFCKNNKKETFKDMLDQETRVTKGKKRCK